jgi:hypothetical protein
MKRLFAYSLVWHPGAVKPPHPADLQALRPKPDPRVAFVIWSLDDTTRLTHLPTPAVTRRPLPYPASLPPYARDVSQREDDTRNLLLRGVKFGIPVALLMWVGMYWIFRAAWAVAGWLGVPLIDAP